MQCIIGISLLLHYGIASYLFGNDPVGFYPHGGLELLDRR